MQRIAFFLYGVFSHGLFLIVYAWMAAFIGNLGFGYLRTMDSAPTVPFATALTLNTLLVGLFAIQHSVMARPAFKKWWTQYIPEPIERSTYVLASNLVMMLLLWQWQPMGGTVWNVHNPTGRCVLMALFAVGWLMVPAVSLLINHFDLFGTRQVWLHLRGKTYEHAPFATPLIYRIVRHPLYVGWMIAFWATPTMSVTHFVFALLMTGYILLAIPLEERDLHAHFGERYARYRQSVGPLIPRFGRKRRAEQTPVAV